MKQILDIDNVGVQINKKQVLKNINLKIKEGSWVTISGSSASGKTTLIRAILRLIDFSGDIKIADHLSNEDNIKQLRLLTGVVLEDCNMQFIGESVEANLAFPLENKLMPKEEIREKIKEIAKQFRIEHLLKREPFRLSGGEKQRVNLATSLITSPKILILDEAFSMIDEKEKHELLSIIKEIHEQNKITILNVTSNLEDSLMGERLIILKNGEIVINDETMNALEKDSVIRKLGLELPFMVDLSIKLELYGLLDDIILDMEEMVDMLWK